MKIIQVIDFKAFGGSWLKIAVGCAPFADIIWFRIKNEPDEIIEKNAVQLRKALPDKRLILSARADIASAAGFQGVQLGAGTKPCDWVKKSFPGLLTGYSAHSTQEILSVNADFYTLSPVFFTEKDYEVKPIGPVDVSSIHKEIYALGGINAGNAGKLEGKGYAGVAGISFYKELEKIKKLPWAATKPSGSL